MTKSKGIGKGANKQDLMGRRFERLEVVGPAPSNKGGRAVWMCRCDCGVEKPVAATSLKSGSTTSCGCRGRERLALARIKHGATAGGQANWHPLYRTWASLKLRCLYPLASGYKNYGGRGITICDSWRNDFLSFVQDVGPKPGPGYSLDRIDNDGNYEPGNVRWATRKEQTQNRRRTVS